MNARVEGEKGEEDEPAAKHRWQDLSVQLGWSRVRSRMPCPRRLPMSNRHETLSANEYIALRVLDKVNWEVLTIAIPKSERQARNEWKSFVKDVPIWRTTIMN